MCVMWIDWKSPGRGGEHCNSNGVRPAMDTRRVGVSLLIAGRERDFKPVYICI